MSGINIPDGRTLGVYAKARWLDHEHLTNSDQRQIVADVARLAQKIIGSLGDGDQLVLGLQHLIDAKDCFVRQSVLDAEVRKADRLP